MKAEFAGDLEERAMAGEVGAQLALAERLTAEGKNEAAVQWLWRGADAGHAKAKHALGLHLMTVPPYDALQGVEWTKRAAADGHAEASRLLALLSASGLGMPQSWDRAFGHLETAAELGEARARAELAALAGEWELARDSAGLDARPRAEWKRLRNKIDLTRWLKAASPRSLATAPRIFSVSGFLAPACCDWLIDLGRPKLTRAQTFSNQTGALGTDKGRTNSAAQIGLAHLDMVLVMVRARISACIGLPGASLEDSSVLHYREGEQYLPHFDFFDTRLPNSSSDVATRGQRVLTFLVYLNDDFEGGETGFPRIGRSFKGHKGDALVFWNVRPDFLPEPLSLHAGMPPARGEKWLFSQWVRYRKA